MVNGQFQFPARNSVCSDATIHTICAFFRSMFQFPARNSVCSDALLAYAATMRRVFQFPARNSVCSDLCVSLLACGSPLVSIPRSEFCLFGRDTCRALQRFVIFVSIPRSEFCLFGRVCGLPDLFRYTHVSIPRSEFCLFGQFTTTGGDTMTQGFNSPLGILFVRTRPHHCGSGLLRSVSIPRSEFCLFGQFNARTLLAADYLFQFPARNSVCSDRRSGLVRCPPEQFQFPARNSVCSDFVFCPLCRAEIVTCFNSPLGILFVRTQKSKR